MKKTAGLILIIAAAILFRAVDTLPTIGDPQSPSATHVSPRYIENGPKETGAANMVTGVNDGFTRTLELVGYRLQAQGKSVNLQLGFSHPVIVEPMEGVAFEVEGNNRLHISGIDKQIVGTVAAKIKSFRPPEPYKGKGIKETGQYILRKEGKKK